MSTDREIIVILPDIRSTHNTGAFFRTADAVGVKKIFLTGITAPPPHPHLLKVSLGAEGHVPWEYCQDSVALLRQLTEKGYTLIAVEQTENSQDFRTINYPSHVAVIFGNEVGGISQKILALADAIVEIPMHGKKESLNVSVAGGIMLYHLRSQ